MIVLLTTVFQTSISVAGKPGKSQAAIDSELIWRVPTHDGINCLYLFLKVADIPVSYQKVTQAVGESPNLLSLRDASCSFGCDVTVLKPKPEKLGDMPLPAIAHLENARGNGGGFFLLIDINEERVSYISGSNACLRRITREDFLRRWTGYAIAREFTSGKVSENARYITLLIASGLLLAFSVVRIRTRLSTRQEAAVE